MKPEDKALFVFFMCLLALIGIGIYMNTVVPMQHEERMAEQGYVQHVVETQTATTDVVWQKAGP